MEFPRVDLDSSIDSIPLLEKFNDVDPLKVSYHAFHEEFFILCWLTKLAEAQVLFAYIRHSLHFVKDIKSYYVHSSQVQKLVIIKFILFLLIRCYSF